MGYYTFRPVLLVPATKLKEFNAIMERHGYGPQTVVASAKTAVIASASAKEAEPTHYVISPTADAGFMAALKLALAQVNKLVTKPQEGTIATLSKVQVTSQKIGEVLAANNVKLKEGSAVIDEDQKPPDEGELPVKK